MKLDGINVVTDFAADPLSGGSLPNAASWDAWVRAQDARVRARIDRGVEDSISNLILAPPRIRSVRTCGGRSVSYSAQGAFGDDVVVYQKR